MTPFNYVFVINTKEQGVILIGRMPESHNTIMGGAKWYEPANDVEYSPFKPRLA